MDLLQVLQETGLLRGKSPSSFYLVEKCIFNKTTFCVELWSSKRKAKSAFLKRTFFCRKPKKILNWSFLSCCNWNHFRVLFWQQINIFHGKFSQKLTLRCYCLCWSDIVATLVQVNMREGRICVGDIFYWAIFSARKKKIHIFSSSSKFNFSMPHFLCDTQK